MTTAAHGDTGAPPAGRKDALQVLRFVAAAGVAFTHLADPVLPRTSPARLFPWIGGVDLFFVLSGFVMTWILARRPAERRAGAFLRARITRIVPAYWAATLLAAAALWARPALSGHVRPTVAYLLASLAFLPVARPGDGEVVPMLAQGWTLEYEMMFYLMWSLALALGKGAGLVAMLLAGLVGVAWLWPGRSVAMTFWGDPIILELAGGMAIARLCLAGWRLSGQMATVGLIAAAVLMALTLPLCPRGTPRLLTLGLPAMLAVACAAGAPDPSRDQVAVRWLVAAGEASYLLYLIHGFVGAGVQWVAGHLGLVRGWATILVGCAASLLLSLALHRWGERPLLAALRGRRPVALSGPAASQEA